MEIDESSQLLSLESSLQPLKKHFNSHREDPRFMALLSPVWPGWSVQGARAVQESIINKFPDAELDISIVWIKMLSGDSESTAKKSAGMFNDYRVRHFYDPAKRSGKAIADTLGYPGKVAWDIYLFYAAGGVWIETPPKPNYWMHQLSENWADREHFRKGDDLVKELLNVMIKFLGIKIA